MNRKQSRLLLCFLLFSFSVFNCRAQFTDDFSDGDLTANPPWAGDLSSWTDTLGRLRSNDTVASSKYHLSTPSALSSNAQWEWWDSLQFNTSSANFIDIYLMADSANLEAASFNGYFVRIGNTADEISLYKRSGSTLTEIIDGMDGLLNNSNNVMRIKVTRDAGNVWTLLRDSTGTGNNFITEGTVTDAVFSTSSYFGIVVQQSTSSFFKKHWFDDFYAGPIVGDTMAPALQQLSVVSSTQLDLKFSEVISLATAENELNYSVNNGIGNPSSAVRDLNDSSLVHLSFSTPFSNGVTNTITVSGIQDPAGNSTPSFSQNFSWFVAVPPVFKDVLINEIFADPSPQVGLPNAEFIEIYNTSTKTFDLSGWQFSDGSSTGTLGGFILFPDSFLILCPNNNVADYSAFGTVMGLTGFPSLNNSGDNLSLTDNSGTLVDVAAYDTSWYHDDVKKNGGYTLELINPFNPCNSGDNWIASADSSGGTPGKMNSVFDTLPDTQPPSLVSVNIISPTQITLSFSETMDSASLANGSYAIDNGLTIVSVLPGPGNSPVVTLTLAPQIDTAIVYTVSAGNVSDCSGNLIGANDSLQFVIGYQPVSGDVIINEIFADPTPQVGLPDAEFAELYNRSNKFLDLSSCDLSGASFPAGTTLLPGGYLILTGASTANLFASFGNVAPMGSWSSTFLTNSGKDLVLSLGAQTIDRVFYDISWYADPAKDDGGWSLERINPIHPCSGADNWKASVDPSGGSPGKINSVYSTASDTVPPSVSGVTIVSSTQIILHFSERMDSASLVTNYTISNGISVTSVQPQSPDFTSVLLNVSPALDSAIMYTGNILYVSDCSGNSISNQAFSFGIGIKPGAHEVVINEIYPDPDASVSSLPEIEFAELYNKTAKVVNLENFKFSDGSTVATLSGAVILPNDYLILCPAANQSEFAAYGKTLGLSSFPSLNNAGDALTLKDDQGNLIHEVNYSDEWYGDEIKKDGGWTLEMIDPENPCGESANWRASADSSGGTPGKINSVKGINPDILAPKILGAFALTPFSVIVYFDEIMDSLSATTASYNISNGINISAVIVPDKKTVQLNLANALQPKILYSVSASGMSDCLGNISSGTLAEFALSEQGEPGDIIINEVLFNPRISGSDFVEVYNNSGKIINLQNWELANIDNDSVSNRKVISAVPLVMFPEDYLVFTKDTANIIKEYLMGKSERYWQMPSLPSYNDDSGTVILISNLGVATDAFSYTDDMQFALLKDNDGVSLERIDFNRPASDVTNWHSAAEAVGWATPGYRNSQYNPSEGDGTNVSVEPEIFSPDNDGLNDILNINYKFDSPGFVSTIVIYDAKGRVVRNLTRNALLGTEGTFSWDGISDSKEKARIGIYVVLFEAYDLTGKVLHLKKTCVLAGKMD